MKLHTTITRGAARTGKSKLIVVCIQITFRQLCFGVLGNAQNKIVDAAPCGAWAIGKNTSTVVSYWKNRGAKITIV